MRKRMNILCVGCGLLLVAAPFMAAHAVDVNQRKFFVALDYVGKGNIEDGPKAAEPDSVAIVNDEGGIPQPSISSDAGVGVRVGMLFPSPIRNLRIGASIGYVYGPNGESKVYDPVDPPGALRVKFRNNFIRALLEMEQLFPMNNAFSWKLGGGVGIARGKTEQEFIHEGYYSPLENSVKSRSTTGLTFEISPGIVIHGERLDWGLGIRYADYPRIKASDTTYKVDYSGFGFYAAVAF